MLRINFLKRIRPVGNIPDQLAGAVFEINDWEDLHSFDDKVILHTSAYLQIFGRRRKEERLQAKKGIVKIVNKSNNNVIYRQYYGQSGIAQNQCGLTSLSVLELQSTIRNCDFEIHKTSRLVGRFRFFWDHPLILVRIPMKIALVALGLGVLAVILAIFSLDCYW